MIYPVLLCLFASLSTGLGGVAVALFKNISDRAMSFFQGFAAGVMIAVSLVEMFPRCYENLLGYMDAEYAVLSLLVLFLCGWLGGWGISLGADCRYRNSGGYSAAKRISLVTTAVMVLHNLPEGMLTVFSGLQDARFGLEMALAVSLHNIPEGMVVASGIMYLTSSRLRAVGYSFFAGISEFVGGVAAVLIFGGVAGGFFIGGVLAAVGGIMMQISICELVPNSLRLSGRGSTLSGILAGAAAICISLGAI